MPFSSVRPNISAIVKDHAGEDVTSSFKVMVYQEPKQVAESNLTNRQAFLSRAITWCSVQGTTFVRSYCFPETFRVGTMQRYTIICQRENLAMWTGNTVRPGTGAIVTTGEASTQRPTLVERQAHCEPDEVCITTFRYSSEANCVNSKYFTEIMDSWNGTQSALKMVNTMAEGDTRHALNYNLGGMSAGLILSDANGTTPIEVDTLDMEAGISGRKKGTMWGKQSKKCRDCVDLETGAFEPDTNFLKTEARLLTTGAAAGILWLAIMSG